MSSARIIYTPPDERIVKRPRSKFTIFVSLGTVFLIAVIVGFVFVVRMPKFRIQNIRVDGTVTLSSDEIKEELFRNMGGYYFFLIPKDSIFFLHTKKLELILKDKFPRIYEVFLKSEFPDRLVIFLREREMWGIFCKSPEVEDRTQNFSSVSEYVICAYIDRSGFAYEAAPRSEGYLIKKIKSDTPNIKVGMQLVDKKLIDQLDFLRDGLKNINLVVVEYELLSEVKTEMRLAVADGFKILFRKDSDLENALTILQTVLNEEIKDRKNRLEYIDLRFGNKVFYKMQ